MKSITYAMPDNTDARKFITYLSQILNFSRTKEELNLSQESHGVFSPITTIALKSSLLEPHILFHDSAINPLTVGTLHLGSHLQNLTKPNHKSSSRSAITTKQDPIGEYLEEKGENQTFYWLSIAELARRLKKTEITLDHTGINLPTKQLSQTDWEDLINQLSKETVLYDYPGEPWPFIIPATPEEQTGKITNTQLKRGPKFELVYDQYTPVPLIQFAVGTDLSQQEVQELFPGPYAETFPSLAHLFKAVYIYSPWQDLAIRFDIGYAGERIEDNLLKYLLTEGKRRQL
jgi:hypothetical protein